MTARVQRPEWLMPTWLCLTQDGTGASVHLDAMSVVAVTSRGERDPCMVLMAGGVSVSVLESQYEVIVAIGKATNFPRCCQ